MTATVDEVSKAVVAAIKARESLLRDVIAETTEADRGKLMNICINSIPNKLLFIEGVILNSALSKTSSWIFTTSSMIISTLGTPIASSFFLT